MKLHYKADYTISQIDRIAKSKKIDSEQKVQVLKAAAKSLEWKADKKESLMKLGQDENWFIGGVHSERDVSDYLVDAIKAKLEIL